MSLGKLSWKAVGSTDIGGGRENQDAFFVWENPSRGLMVTGVLDGHGRDVGKVAATVGSEYLLGFCENNQDALLSNPYDFLVKGTVEAHAAIKEGFTKALSAKGFEVKETTEGYLVKKKSNKSQWMCVHGGTSCSLVAIVGMKLYTANCGDSTGILSASHPILCDNMLKFVGDAGDTERKTSSMEVSGTGDELSNTLVITSDHSPESPVEFNRMRAFRASEQDPKQPSLLVVYDASQQDKSRCPAVFELDAQNRPVVTNRGSYYKNVRKEWASLVAAPSSAKFQDALAFTRSIGDFHLHIYGVSELPEVHCVDLQPIFAALAAAGAYRGIQKPSTTVQEGQGSVEAVGKSEGGDAPTKKKKGLSLSPMRGRGSMSPMRISPMEVDDQEVGKKETQGSPPVTTPSGEQQTIVDPNQFPSLCVVLASDGIWDNWEYSHVSDFVMNPKNGEGNSKGSGGRGVEAAVVSSESLIKSNAVHAHRNFGDQADNATGVVLFIQPVDMP